MTDNGYLGWGWKFAYCIAFSIDGATDVTRRYVRNPAKYGAHRNRAPEEVLLWLIYEIRKARREKMSPSEQRRLVKEDQREERELRAFTAAALATEINQLLPGTRRVGRPDEVKTPVSREEGAAEWLHTRQSEDTGPDRPGEGR
jgi:peptide-N4-(N-acetyl-beta-glucosaminyl)asparagine amidase